MSTSHKPASRLIASASLFALLTGCITAEAPSTQELAVIDKATVTLMPASAAERAMADKQDVLTQAKFWATEYDKNPNEYEASLKYARVLRGIGSSPRAAEVAHKSLTDFILDAAYQAAEHTLLDQRLFMVSGSQYQALLEMLDRPESDNAGVANLFSRRPVWAEK